MDQTIRELAAGIDALYEPFETPLSYGRGTVFVALCGVTWGVVWLVGWAAVTLLG
jgi:hypothetical protein